MISPKFLITLLLFFIISYVRSQDFSNKGTEFWVGYGYHQVMTNGLSTQNAQDMVLYFTSDVAANVTVAIASVGWVKTYRVSANTVTESDPIPKSGAQDARLLLEGVYKSGIHITSDQPIVAYAHIYDKSVSGATLLFPVNTLGQDYFSVNFTQRSNQPNSNSWAYVVATEDNTVVEITPSGNTLSHNAGQPFTIPLNKGEIYNLMGSTTGNDGADLTGTRIRSISSGASACKKIAVFSGSGRLSINCDNSITTSDNTIQQVFPRSAWGKKYLTVPTSGLPNNYFRIIVSDPTTVVSIDGVPATNLVNNFYYQILANTPKSIVADKPIMVAQYITSTNDSQTPTCGNSYNSNGDPEMIYLSPTEQTIDKITLNSTEHYQITSHFINVVLKSSAISSFTIDGARPAVPFATHPGDASYSYVVLKVNKGTHTLRADSGFNAIAYGYGGTESYGYNAGTNIKDLYQFITLRNQFASVTLPETCKDTRFYFYLTLPFKASALTWDFAQNSALTPNQLVVQNSPVPDSSYTRDGKVLYMYALPSLYSYNATGTYPIKITANNQTSDGCSGLEEILYDLHVVDPPVGSFTFGNAGCLTDSVLFANTSTGSGRTLEKWLWQFGDGTTDSVSNPHKKFATSGTYQVKATAINDIGCAGEASKPLVIAPKPVAKFSLTNATCATTPVNFTDQSTITGGKITKWNWDFGDGSSQTYANGNPFSKVYSSAGKFVVTLVVETDNGCKSDTTRQSISIAALPVSNFILPVVCANDPFAAFTDSSFLPGNNQAILTYAWNFGDPNATAANPNTVTVQNPRHKYSAAGNYPISLTVGFNSGCTAVATKTLTVNGATPVADFSLVDTGIICGNTIIGVTSNATVDIGSVRRVDIIWDFDNHPTTIETDSATVPGKIYHHGFSAGSTAKVYRIKCIAYSGVSCLSEKTIVITIYPVPQVTFSTIPPVCLQAGDQTITAAKETTGLPGTYAFSGTGINSQGIFNPVVAGAGTTMINYVFTSSDGCRDTATQSIVVVPNPVVHFNSPVYNLEGGSVVLNPSISTPVTKYTWSPGTYLSNSTLQNPESTAKDSITYQLTVSTQEGCVGTGKVTVLILKKLSVPNAFSPNGDGINDFWNIPSLQSYPSGIVEVFNRYGSLVFRSTGYSNPWAGTYNGTSLPTGVYYYIIDLKNGTKPVTGYVTLLK